jgi:hypothetical protein
LNGRRFCRGVRVKKLARKPNGNEARSRVPVAIVGAIHNVKKHRADRSGKRARDRSAAIDGILNVRVRTIGAERPQPGRARLP